MRFGQKRRELPQRADDLTFTGLSSGAIESVLRKKNSQTNEHFQSEVGRARAGAIAGVRILLAFLAFVWLPSCCIGGGDESGSSAVSEVPDNGTKFGGQPQPEGSNSGVVHESQAKNGDNTTASEEPRRDASDGRLLVPAEEHHRKWTAPTLPDKVSPGSLDGPASVSTGRPDGDREGDNYGDDSPPEDHVAPIVDTGGSKGKGQVEASDGVSDKDANVEEKAVSDSTVSKTPGLNASAADVRKAASATSDAEKNKHIPWQQ